MVAVPLLLLAARMLVTKTRSRDGKRCAYPSPSAPEEEADAIPDLAIYLVAGAAVLEGFSLALYSTSVAGHQRAGDGNAVLQALRFASITLLCFHRVLRPANRVDPLRTVMELEVVSVCWDALDGSTLYELIASNGADPSLRPLSAAALSAARCLMGFWYATVGLRLTFMFFTHLSPASLVYSRFYLPLIGSPLEFSKLPTVDRTMQAMRLRAVVVMAMAAAEVYASALRIALWAQGSLGRTQQEMTLKNITFLISAYSAYSMWTGVTSRDWNSRELGLGLKIPLRETQRVLSKWTFALCMVVESAVLTAFAAQGRTPPSLWALNLLLDALLLLFFLVYCGNSHRRHLHEHASWLAPRPGYVLFPTRLMAGVSAAMMLSLFLGRVPAIYAAFESGPQNAPWTLDNAALVLSLSVVTITALGLFLSNSYMCVP